MLLKRKLLVVISLVAIIVVTASISLVSFFALESMRDSALERFKTDLTAKRVLVSTEISNYINTIAKQAIVMANDISIKEATQSFISGFNTYPINLSSSKNLYDYYNNKFKAVYDKSNDIPINTATLYNQLKGITLALQSDFIALNSNPLGEKDTLNSLDNNTVYDKAHQRHHPTIRKFLKEFGFYDIFIVEPEGGYIVYSVFKELDYATSLNHGPYKNSGIAEAFNKGKNLRDGETYLTDFNAYLPSYNNSASFLSTPIYQDNRLQGVLIFQMPIDKINAVMTQYNQWRKSGFGESGEIYLVGEDFTLRNESRFFIEDKQNYLKTIRSAGIEAHQKIKNKDTTISLQPVNTKGVHSALKGLTGFDIFKDYRQKSVLSSFAPLKIGDQKWAIISEIDEEEALQSVNQLSQHIGYISLVVLAVAVVVSLLVAFFFAGTLIKPLNNIAVRFNDLSQGKADLTVRIENSGTPEIDEIGRGFNGFISSLNSVFGNVKSTVNRIASSGTELGVTTEQTHQTLNEQSEAVADVQNSIIQLKQAMSNINHQTDTALIVTREAKERTQDTAEKGTQAVNNIRQLVDEVDKSASTIKELQHKVTDIGEVLIVINSIAEQTNLLALNAAIEAARAGEHGRGFAVVADEVRQLASRTQNSTITIQTQIEELNQSAVESVDTMKRASLAANSGIELVEGVTETLQELSRTVINLSDMNTEISNASKTQNNTIEYISESFTSVNERAKDITSASTNISGVANELSNVSEELKSETDRFIT